MTQMNKNVNNKWYLPEEKKSGNSFAVLDDQYSVRSEAVVPRPVGIPPAAVPKALLQRPRNSVNPVGSRGSGRKKKFRPPGWRNITAGHVADYGYKAWQLAKHLATLVNVEDKKWDVDGSGGITLSNTPTIVNLSNIAQGNDYFNRSGDSILGQKIEFRAILASNANVASTTVRLLIVCDRDQRGTDPVLGDVLAAGAIALCQPYNPLSGDRFEILYDEQLSLNSAGAGLATSGTSTTYTVVTEPFPPLIRKWNRHLKYIGTAGADASNYEGALYLMCYAADASNGPTLRYTFRLHFTDN